MSSTTEKQTHDIVVDASRQKDAYLAADRRGDATRSGKGDGDAFRNGEGYGDAIRSGEGSGNAFRYGKGDGNAFRIGTGDGIAFIIGRVGDGCFEEDSRGKRFPETIYPDSRGYWLNVREIDGAPLFTAGCRRFSLEEALEHWGDGYTGTGDNKAYIHAIENWVANSGGE